MRSGCRGRYSPAIISIHTVKSHVYSLYRKMDVKSRHELIQRIGVFGGTDGAPGKAR